jgi:hypothetical protein
MITGMYRMANDTLVLGISHMNIFGGLRFLMATQTLLPIGGIRIYKKFVGVANGVACKTLTLQNRQVHNFLEHSF